jgi:hypothetical protein
MQFWEHEIALVQKAMGFKHPAKIEFDRMDLSNEDAEKALLVQLADRNVISDELLQTRFGLDPDMEKYRLNRESRERKTTRMVNKAGPWHDPQPENSLKKIALQSGIATPSQVGLELDKKKSGEKTALEMKVESMPPKPTGPAKTAPQPKAPGEGRPKLSKDSEKRKPKEFAPQTGAHVMVWATRAQDQINEILNPILLNFYNKKNMRSLSSTETMEVESTRTKVLFSIPPMTKIDQDIVLAALEKIDSVDTHKKLTAYKNWLNQISQQITNQLSIEEQKQLKASFYSMVYDLT